MQQPLARRPHPVADLLVLDGPGELGVVERPVRPARLQQLGQGPLVERLPAGSELWIDGGHNPDAAALIADFAQRHWQDGRPLTLLFASLKSKDASATLAPFRGIAARVLALPIPGHDCRDPAELAGMARDMGFAASPHPDLQSALAAVGLPLVASTRALIAVTSTRVGRSSNP